VDNLKSKGLSALIWDFFGKIAKFGTTFIVTIVLARLLEPSDFGLIAMVMVVVMIAMIFTDVGLGSALIQRRRVLPIHYDSVFYFNIFIGFILTIITFFSASWISEFYHNSQLVPLTQVISLMFVINAFGSMQTSKLRKELNYAALAKANVSAAILSGITGITLAFYGAGVWSLVAQVLSRGVFYNIFIWTASGWIPSLMFSFKALKQLWGFGFRMFLSGLIDVIYNQLDVLIIGKLFMPAILGFFDQAKKLNTLIIQFSSGSIMAVMFPVLSKIQNDLPKFQNVAIKTLGIISFVAFFLSGALYLVSHELIAFLFTEKWLPSVEYFKILVLSGFAYPVSVLLVNILSSRGNSKAFLRLEIYKKVLQSINLGMVFLWGIIGYLYGMLFVSLLGVSLNILFASREIKLPVMVFARPILVQMIITIISVLTVMLFTNGIELSNILMILMKGIMFSIIYFMINIIFKTSSYFYLMDQTKSILKRRT
jgi:O-antigen/teichoic acid export membrane protein